MLHEAWDTSNGWSPTDYSLNRKIAFYRIKDAYKPTTFLWTLNYDMKSYSWAFVNDAKNLVKTELIYGLRDFEGNWVYQQKESINLCETERIYQSFDYDLTKFDTNGILYATWKDHNGETNFTWQFIGCPKSWGHIEDSVISVDILGSDKSFYKVEIHSQSFCPIVSLSDCHQTTFAQNYFPLFANEPVVIKVKEEDLAKLAPICYLNDNCKV